MTFDRKNHVYNHFNAAFGIQHEVDEDGLEVRNGDGSLRYFRVKPNIDETVKLVNRDLKELNDLAGEKIDPFTKTEVEKTLKELQSEGRLDKDLLAAHDSNIDVRQE